MRCIPVCTTEGIAKLAMLAKEIWHEYWPSLIGLNQTDYMVEKFQSEHALAEDIFNKGYLYWLLYDESRMIGYTGAQPQAETNRLFISKIYLNSHERGKGYASEVMEFYEQLCEVNGLTCIYLTVNKGNELAIRAYKGKGFVSTEAVETDIGGGFIMDDYVMEKRLNTSADPENNERT